MAKRFKWNGEIFEVGTHADITLMDLLKIQREVEDADLGIEMHLGEIKRLGEKFKNLTPREAEMDPEALMLLSVTIWVAKVKKLRETGDYTTPVSFIAMLHEPAHFEVIPDPADRRPKAAKKATSPKGGARGAANQVPESSPTT